jgi:tetratricopeptide (TPR) repeat protein
MPAVNQSAPSRRHHWIVAAALLALTLAAYSNSFQAGFVLDNKGLILLDPRVHAATEQNLSNIFTRTYWWPTGEAGIYRPFTTLTYLFNYAILGSGDRPAGYHRVNCLLHFGNVLLVYMLGLRCVRDWRLAAALAALWSVHPVLTESVTNIVGRADLLAGMAILGGLLLYLESAERKGARRLAWLAALFLVSLAGVLSKESAATLVGILVLYELAWWNERSKWKSLAWGCVAAGLPLLTMWVQRSAVLAAVGHSEFPFTDNPLVGAGFSIARLTSLNVMVRGLGLVLWPARLSADYSYRQIPLAQGTPQDWLCWLAVAALASGMVLLYRRNRSAFFFAGFAFVTYLPSSNMLFPIGSIMAERFLYLPSIGVIACVVLACDALARRQGSLRWAAAATGLIVVCLAARTWTRNLDWRDDLTLATATVRSSPASYKAHESLALALYNLDPGRSRLDDAIVEYEKSLAILDSVPDALSSPDTYMFAGGYMMQKGDRLKGGDSAAVYRKALSVLMRGDAVVQAANRMQNERMRDNPALVGPPTRFAPLYRLLSAVHLRLDEGEPALRHALYARELAPADAETYKQLAEAYWGVHDGERTAIALLEGIMLTSDVSLRDAAVAFYRGSGVEGADCAVVTRAGQAALNPTCAPVHRHMCAAADDAIRLQTRTGHPDDAANVRRMALGPMQCDPRSLDTEAK